ncbi:MAG: hypothetical protein PHS41_12600 [Victivallaceae bacterium]|nr:hypothetical protein [Victivallaceae bacterium]
MLEPMKEILFVAAASGEGQFRQIVDPMLAAELTKAGFRCHSCYLPQLRQVHLQECAALVIVRTPMPGHAQDDSELFRKWTPEILDAVQNGMGLAIFFSESYGRSEGTLREFTRPLGLKCFFNRIEELDPERRGMIPNLDGGETVLAEVSGIAELDRMEIVTGGGHGTQQLSCVADDHWEVLLRGSSSCSSQPFPLGFYSNGSSEPLASPVFAAARTWGEGKIVAFPGSAPLWIASGYLPRFEGYLLRQHNNAGLLFLTSIFNRIARNGNTDSPALEELDRVWQADRTFSFRYVTPVEQQELRDRKPCRIFIGTIPDGMTPEAFAAEAESCGCDAVIPIHDYDALTPESWVKLREQLARIEGIDALPGYEQIDDEGNASVVFSVTDLPNQRRSYPNSNLLEDLLVKLSGYVAIYARPAQNRYPLWRYGGYNAVEFDSPESLAMFREKVASASALSLMTVNRGVSPREEIFHTYVLAPNATAWRRNLTENFHHTFVASGSLMLTGFALLGPTLMLDDWEGFWYEWDNGARAELSISLEADSPIVEMTVWDGADVFLKFEPGSFSVDLREPVIFDRDLRLTVSARCADGSELISSFPLYTRNRRFWAHVGSDQMNDYHNVFVENSNGLMGIGDRFYEPYGFVTCGFAWGDYVRITSPVPWADLMPSGIEVSSMTANFKSYHPSPFVITEDGGADFLNHHQRRLGFCDADVHIVHSRSDGMWLERSGATWTGHGGRVFHPTRAIDKSSLWTCSGTYEIPRWQPYAPTEVRFHLILQFLRSFRLTAGRIVIGQSIHVLKDGLTLNGKPLSEFLMDGTDVASEWKEWDNLNAFELFRSHPDSGPALEIPTGLTVGGDASGTYRFCPPATMGRWLVRAWRWRNDGFLLSYEWEPERRHFAAAEEIALEYSITLGTEVTQ